MHFKIVQASIHMQKFCLMCKLFEDFLFIISFPMHGDFFFLMGSLWAKTIIC